jgi:DNA-binding LacI/PurR family transcriptional regulator
MRAKRDPAKQSGSVTIREVAHEAGVSMATVSKVLNNQRYVSVLTRRRIEAAIVKLGYQPNVSAQQLQGGAAQIIALDLVQTQQLDPLEQRIDFLLDSSFLFRLLSGIGRVAAATSYNLLWSMPSGLPPDEHAAAVVRLWTSGRCDGVIVAGLTATDPRLPLLRARGCPYVVVGNPSDDSLSIDTDNVAAGRLAAEALLARGHRRLATVGGGPMTHLLDRLMGYAAPIANAGATLLPEPVAHGETSFERGRDQLRQIMAGAQCPTGLFAFNNLAGLGVIAEARMLGVRVPDDLAVIAFDDDPNCETSAPPLACIAQDVIGLGQGATKMLLTLLAGGTVEPRRVVLPARLIERQSLGGLLGEADTERSTDGDRPRG